MPQERPHVQYFDIIGKNIMAHLLCAFVSKDLHPLVYQGQSEETSDSNIVYGTDYYYAAYSFDSDGDWSKPVYLTIKTDLMSIYGEVLQNDGKGIAGVQFVARDSDGGFVDASESGRDGKYVLSNFQAEHYRLEASHSSYQIQNPTRAINIVSQSIREDFLGVPVPTLTLMFDSGQVRVCDSMMLQWAYRNIDNEATVNLDLYRNGNWESIARNVPILKGYVDWGVSEGTTQDAIIRVSLSLEPSVYAEHHLAIEEVGDLEGGACRTRKIFSSLGGLGTKLDSDVFKFTGDSGEAVTLKLEADTSKTYTEGKATLILKYGSLEIKKDLGAVPKELTAVLPKNGQYEIWVVEQSWGRTLGFTGGYCLTVKSSGGAWQTPQATSNVE
jgi:hypothetical protein